MITMGDKLHIEVTSEAQSDTKLEVQERGHEAVVDEPSQFGGEDEGPNPLEYMFTGLAGCLNVTIHHIANEKEIEVEELEINVTGDIDLQKFMTGEGDRAGFQDINVEIEMTTNTDPEIEASLIEEAEERCPVSDNLQHETIITVDRA
ncbi:MAG: OsmC family protein [Candidatus Nanohaloarchaea archaeon]